MPPTEPTPDGGTREVPPDACPNGHPLRYPNVLIGSDVARIWYLCRRCGMQISIDHRTDEWTVTQEAVT